MSNKINSNTKKEVITAIVLSGGKGKRMGSDISKQYMEMKAKPILYYSLKVFEDSDVDEIVLVVGKDDVEFVSDEIIKRFSFKKVKRIVVGGKERYNSVYNGLCAVESEKNDITRYVLIHDGARPFLSNEVIKRTIDTVIECGACVVGVPAKDTIKVINGDNNVESTPDRKYLWQVQTPQAFEYSLVKECYKKIIESGRDDITDDSMVVESMSKKEIKMVMGDYNNIKITTPEDIILGNAILENACK